MPPILPPGSPSLQYIFQDSSHIPPGATTFPLTEPPSIPARASKRSLIERPSTSRLYAGAWSLTTAAVNDSSERLIQPPTSTASLRRARSSSTLRSQDVSSRWDFEYRDSKNELPLDTKSRDSLFRRAAKRVSRINTLNISRKFGLRAASGLIVSPDEAEEDDVLHDPVRTSSIGPISPLSPRNKRGLTNFLGFSMIVVGIILILVGLPVVSRVEETRQYLDACEADPDCIRADLPLLKNVRHGPIDPDTPPEVMIKTDIHDDTLDLVFSDEFNTHGRTFYPGDDPYFQGTDFWYGVTQDLEWYDPDAISTANGTLNIRFDKHKNHDLDFRSGMLQSWNMLCFKGGYVEARISLPGSAEIPGFWPGFWASANLGRAGYAATTDGMWPYSYWDECDTGILPNQSGLNGESWLPGMRLPGCVCNASDTLANPTPGRSRSAPELDMLEGSVVYSGPGGTDPMGTGSQSLQVAPFDPNHSPNYANITITNDTLTLLNTFKGSPVQESISYVTNLDRSWYNGTAYATFGLEYQPGANGYATFFINGVQTWHIDADAIGPIGEIGRRLIPVEPMTLIANLGMSPTFAAIEFDRLTFPATLRMDYIRVWQNEQNESLGHWLGCDPPGYETTAYIANHPKAYMDWNVTTWEQAGYTRPANALRDGCVVEW